MTTIAVKDGIMAADSMVSSSYGRKATKIRKIRGSYYGVAGNWDDALQFFEWREKGGDPPSMDDISALEIRKKTLYYWSGSVAEKIKPPYAIGSGADIAMGAMSFGATAEEAVKLACKLDDTSCLPVITTP